MLAWEAPWVGAPLVEVQVGPTLSRTPLWASSPLTWHEVHLSEMRVEGSKGQRKIRGRLRQK